MNILQIFVHTWEDYTHIYMQHTTQCMCSIQKKIHVHNIYTHTIHIQRDNTYTVLTHAYKYRNRACYVQEKLHPIQIKCKLLSNKTMVDKINLFW